MFRRVTIAASALVVLTALAWELSILAGGKGDILVFL
jgi:hypothetical protein